MTNEPEKHPLEPFLPKNALILLLGSFPPPRERWAMNFFYPNWQNDFWRIVGSVFFDDRNRFLNVAEKKFKEADIRSFLSERRIAIYDAAETVIRRKNNASDQFLEIVEPTRLDDLLTRLPECRIVAATGRKAFETTRRLMGEITTISDSPLKIGDFLTFSFQNRSFRLYLTPSSSRAFPMAFEQKTSFYRKMFESIDQNGDESERSNENA